MECYSRLINPNFRAEIDSNVRQKNKKNRFANKKKGNRGRRFENRNKKDDQAPSFKKKFSGKKKGFKKKFFNKKKKDFQVKDKILITKF